MGCGGSLPRTEAEAANIYCMPTMYRTPPILPYRVSPVTLTWQMKKLRFSGQSPDRGSETSNRQALKASPAADLPPFACPVTLVRHEPLTTQRPEHLELS